MNCKVLWITGIVASGKKTLANALLKYLEARNHEAVIVDGGAIRREYKTKFAFDFTDIRRHTELSIDLIQRMMPLYEFILAVFVSPFSKLRYMAREVIGQGNYYELFMNTPVEICRQRDITGLYAAADKKEERMLAGVSYPYEQTVMYDYCPVNTKFPIGYQISQVKEFIEYKEKEQ